MIISTTVTAKIILTRFLTLEQEFNSVHNNFYSYVKSVYSGNSNKITITCPIHGDFEQTPKHHLKGCGCSSCAKIKAVNSKRKSTSKFIEEAIKTHGNRYDYSKVKYTNTHSFVTIICPIHGEFQQRAKDHIRGYNCSKCAGCYSHTNEEYITKARLVHNDAYTYEHIKYKTMSTKVVITCKIHGNFTQTATHHMQGHGCPTCAKAGFDQTKPAILYYLSIDNGQAYKIGITNRTVKQRFLAKDQDKIKIVKTWYYENGTDALNEETRILKEFKQYRYTGLPLLSGTKTSEMFYKDILLLDTLP